MLPMVWAESLEWNKWSSKYFSEEITKGAIAILVRGKSPTRTKNEVKCFGTLCHGIPF
jgi:hypothetical protein